MKNTVCMAMMLCMATAITSPAQTFTSLASFDGSNGDAVFTPVVQGINGNLYGVTDIGGANDSGVVFELTPSGNLTTLYSFCSERDCADGQAAVGGLVQSADGNLYGTTFYGGANNVGTVFKITPAGQLTTLYNFCSQPNCADGSYPHTAMIEAGLGTFYGVTEEGGNANVGTIFEITSAGKFTTLYSFCTLSGCADGEYPMGSLALASNGSLFGTTSFGGGTNEGGTIFQLSSAGQFKILHTFCIQSGCPDGQDSLAGLTQANNGNFYGTTSAGGAENTGAVFEITPTGNFTLLHSFCGRIDCLDGSHPYASLVAANGNLYGTTWAGGSNDQGTIFSINLKGALDTLYNFCAQANCVDGSDPYASLLQATDGIFYGTTSSGGSARAGTVFSLSNGLTPFIATLPAQGRVGGRVLILGNDLTGTTSVAFNGTPAAFYVDSETEITAKVPNGATTGTIEVTTPTGTLSSTRLFRVIE